GATVGKWLVRLRVVRLGEPGPPGIVRGFIRTLVFNLVWMSVFYFPLGVYRGFAGLGAAGQFFGVIAGIGLCLAGFITLLNQCRTKWGHRGVHDFASGCRVISRPGLVTRA